MFNIYVGQAIDPVEVLVDNTTTVRDAYAKAGISLAANSMITHNSNVLSASDFDKTMGQLGITAGDYVNVSQKLKSAMEIVVKKNVPSNYTVVVKSDLTGKIMSYVKDHTLYEGDGEKKTPVFVINATKNAVHACENCINFKSSAKDDEKLQMAIPMECGEEAVRAFVASWQTKAIACEKEILARYKVIADAMEGVKFEG
jgi:hypothetical protein